MVATGRVKAWKTIFEGNRDVPLAYDRQNEVSSTSLPYCLSIKTAEVSNVKTSKGATFQIRLTFFDLTYKQFYGRTWSGPMVAGRSTGGKTKINYNQTVYFHTSLDAEALVVVVEVVAVEPPGADFKQREVGCGWGIFHPFQKDKKLFDTSGAAPPPIKLDMFHGSPRALLFLDEPILGNSHLNSNGCQVQYVIQTHRIMQKAINLIPENTLVSHQDVIPGISDAEKASTGGDILRRPRLLKPMSCYLEKIQVTLNPSLEKLEEELCSQLNEDRINRENKVADGTSISVIERRLQIGVHNGWCYVDKPEVVHLTPDVTSQKGGTRGHSGTRGHQRTPSTSSLAGTLHGATALVHKNRVELDGLLEDPAFSLVFLLEYVLGEPIRKSTKDRKASMAKAATFNITVRWAAFCPLSNMESPEQSLQLIGGPSSIPDSVFVYSLSSENMGSLDSIKVLNGGVLNFSFSNTRAPITKRAKDPAFATLAAQTLNVPTLNLPDTARSQDDSSDILEGQVAGRPPVPASETKREKPSKSILYARHHARSPKKAASVDTGRCALEYRKEVRRSLDFGKTSSDSSGSYLSPGYFKLSENSLLISGEEDMSLSDPSRTNLKIDSTKSAPNEDVAGETKVEEQSSKSKDSEVALAESHHDLDVSDKTDVSEVTEMTSGSKISYGKLTSSTRCSESNSVESRKGSAMETSVVGDNKATSDVLESVEYQVLSERGLEASGRNDSDEVTEVADGGMKCSAKEDSESKDAASSSEKDVERSLSLSEASTSQSDSYPDVEYIKLSEGNSSSGRSVNSGDDWADQKDSLTANEGETASSQTSSVTSNDVNETIEQIIKEYENIQIWTPFKGQNDEVQQLDDAVHEDLNRFPAKRTQESPFLRPLFPVQPCPSTKLTKIPEESGSATSLSSAVEDIKAKDVSQKKQIVNDQFSTNKNTPDGTVEYGGNMMSSSSVESSLNEAKTDEKATTTAAVEETQIIKDRLLSASQSAEADTRSKIVQSARSSLKKTASSRCKKSSGKETLARSMDPYGASYGSQQGMYHTGQMYNMPVGMPGYPSSGYGSVHGYGGVSPMYGGTSPMYGAAAPGMMGVMGYGGQASMHSYQPSTRLNVPVEIAHVRDSVTGFGWGVQRPGYSGMVTELQELPFTPVHAPVMATVPGRHIMSGMSRQAYARLYTVGFPQILDQHGEPPEVVDPNDDLQFVMTKEEMDRLQTNEITLQFLAFARVLTPDAVREKPVPSSIFMTFQFYRFPQVTTERLLLGTLDGQLTSDPNAMPNILQKLNADGSLKKGPPGWQVVYNVDPAYLKPGEGRLFVQHLSQQILHIDVWDGDSLLLIGSCAVELKHLCRQGREGVQVTYELDVITTEYIDYETPTPAGNMAQNGFLKPMEVRSIIKGKLHLRMANVGRPADAKLSKADRMPMSVKPKVIVSSESNGLSGFNGGSLGSLMQHTAATMKPKKSKAKHMVEKNQELAAMIFSRKNEDRSEKSGETNAARKRKLARMEAVRSQLEEDGAKTISSYRTEKEERAREFQTIDLYRKQNKREEILGMLSQALTTEHVLYPTMGTTEFFEFVLKNPYNVEHTVTIQCDDPELMVITDPREWRHFKMVHEIYTSVEEAMFSAEAGKTVDPPQLFLRAKESVNIPFKFLTFKADNSAHQAIPADPHRTKPVDAHSYPGIQKRDPMATRVAKVFFNTPDGKPVGILQVKIEPQPHIIDQTFRFHHPEHSFLKKSIRLPPLHTIPGVPIGGPGISQLVVRCSDPNVICESRKVQPGEPHDIFIKVACGASPQVKKFFLAIYADHFMSRPITVWQIFVHALQRVDIVGSEGQTSRFTLILRGTQASRLVKCYGSHPLEMNLRPSDPFMLAANTLQEVEVGVRPLVSGSKFYYINVVDVDYHQLVRCWLICLTMSQPLITKNYELTLPVGGGKGSNKRLAYTNPYPTRKAFTIHCNRPDMLQFKDTRMVLGPGEVHQIGLRFAPAIAPGATEILVFINDEDDKNEETFCIRATYQ